MFTVSVLDWDVDVIVECNKRVKWIIAGGLFALEDPESCTQMWWAPQERKLQKNLQEIILLNIQPHIVLCWEVRVTSSSYSSSFIMHLWCLLCPLCLPFPILKGGSTAYTPLWLGLCVPSSHPCVTNSSGIPTSGCYTYISVHNRSYFWQKTKINLLCEI